MVVVEQPIIDDGASTIDDGDANSILVDFSDSLGHASRSSLAPTPVPMQQQQQQQQQHQNEQLERELQRQQEQHYQYIQSLLREIEHLRAELDRFSVEVS